MKYYKAIATTLFIIILGVFGATASFAQDVTENTEIKTTQSDSLKLVEVRFVCLMTNMAFDKEQIPVTIDGVVYYGCCNNCVKNLTDNEDHRYAIDPVSKKKVNKAKAVIGATADNKVYYFESKENMKKFDPAKHLSAE